MPTYTVTLSDVEQKGMEYITTDVDFWIQNAVHERARIAMDELAADHIKTELDAGNSVSGTKEEIVMGTNLLSAQARNAEMMKQMVPPEEMIGTKR